MTLAGTRQRAAQHEDFGGRSYGNRKGRTAPHEEGDTPPRVEQELHAERRQQQQQQWDRMKTQLSISCAIAQLLVSTGVLQMDILVHIVEVYHTKVRNVRAHDSDFENHQPEQTAAGRC